MRLRGGVNECGRACGRPPARAAHLVRLAQGTRMTFLFRPLSHVRIIPRGNSCCAGAHEIKTNRPTRQSMLRFRVQFSMKDRRYSYQVVRNVDFNTRMNGDPRVTHSYVPGALPTCPMYGRRPSRSALSKIRSITASAERGRSFAIHAYIRSRSSYAASRIMTLMRAEAQSARALPPA